MPGPIPNLCPVLFPQALNQMRPAHELLVTIIHRRCNHGVTSDPGVTRLRHSASRMQLHGNRLIAQLMGVGTKLAALYTTDYYWNYCSQ